MNTNRIKNWLFPPAGSTPPADEHWLMRHLDRHWGKVNPNVLSVLSLMTASICLVVSTTITWMVWDDSDRWAKIADAQHQLDVIRQPAIVHAEDLSVRISELYVTCIVLNHSDLNEPLLQEKWIAAAAAALRCPALFDESLRSQSIAFVDLIQEYSSGKRSVETQEKIKTTYRSLQTRLNVYPSEINLK